MAAVLNRQTFRTSREMDFFSEKELTTQTGHGIKEWPLVFLKETIDNALDAHEESEISPKVSVSACPTGITVSDNGGGIPAETIAGAMDFTVRVSNREMYVAPDRGAQGNALMTLLAMPYVVDPDAGRLSITSRGVRHDIVCRADSISQEAIIDDSTSDVEDAGGTSIHIQWTRKLDRDGDPVWPFDEVVPVTTDDYRSELQDRAFDLLTGYAVFNPHLTLDVKWFDKRLRFEATSPDWRKWKPNNPTSSHWYKPPHLGRLIAAYITVDRKSGSDRTVSEFLREFDGLSGSVKRKAILGATGLARVNLSELTNGDDLDFDRIGTLLKAMKDQTKPVKAPRLGIIGKDHFTTRYIELGCEPESIEYRKVARVDDGVPFVLESAFGWKGEGSRDRRQIYAGANWSPGVNNPFRSFGSTGEGLEGKLRDMRAGNNEPILFALHLAHPRVEYADRGKSSIVLK